MEIKLKLALGLLPLAGVGIMAATTAGGSLYLKSLYESLADPKNFYGRLVANPEEPRIVSYPNAIKVDRSCLEQRMNDITQRGTVNEVTPRFAGGDTLTGFSVRPNRVGADYANTDKKILGIGFNCQPK